MERERSGQKQRRARERLKEGPRTNESKDARSESEPESGRVVERVGRGLARWSGGGWLGIRGNESLEKNGFRERVAKGKEKRRVEYERVEAGSEDESLPMS